LSSKNATFWLAAEIAASPPSLWERVLTFIVSPKTQAQPRQPPLQKRRFGASKDFFLMSDDFDEPLEDFKD